MYVYVLSPVKSINEICPRNLILEMQMNGGAIQATSWYPSLKPRNTYGPSNCIHYQATTCTNGSLCDRSYHALCAINGKHCSSLSIRKCYLSADILMHAVKMVGNLIIISLLMLKNCHVHRKGYVSFSTQCHKHKSCVHTRLVTTECTRNSNIRFRNVWDCINWNCHFQHLCS